jgi:SAM-dependent methyltransferase
VAGAADDIVALYERQARAWAGDRSRQSQFFEKAWLDRFLSFVAPGGTVLDLGCGFGKPMAAYVLGAGFKVCGVDSSPTMIAMARENFPDEEWRIADMRKLTFARGFAGILAWDSFFHLGFEDQRGMFAVFAEHAAPGAPLMFTSGPRYGEAIGTLHGEMLYHASLDPQEYRDLLAANGFAVVDQKSEDPGCGGHTVWLARRNATMD